MYEVLLRPSVFLTYFAFLLFLELYSTSNKPLISLDAVLPPPMHIRAGVCGKILCHLIDATDTGKRQTRKSPVLTFLQQKFGSGFKEKSIQGNQVRKLLNDKKFVPQLRPEDRQMWRDFRAVCDGFLCGKRLPNHAALVKNLMRELKGNKVGMTLKIHWLHSHLDRFAESNSDFSDEQAERLHQDLKKSVERNRSQPLVNVVNDYCWRRTRDPEESSGQKDNRQHF